MELLEAIEKRHSVRAYTDEPLSDREKAELNEIISRCNKQGKLRIQLITDEPKAFSGMMAKFGRFSGVRNYIALIGPDKADLEEKCGYYGEKIVLRAQQIGLNTCWVALTYSKNKDVLDIRPGEKLCLVISVGHGVHGGHPRRSKSREAVMRTRGNVPEWFIRGVDAALLAPTAVNQQKFLLTLEPGDVVSLECGKGSYTKVDMGIVRYHFEIGAGVNHFTWKDK